MMLAENTFNIVLLVETVILIIILILLFIIRKLNDMNINEGILSPNNNKNIVVHDASIIRNNEHPKFKIGDVINNGYGNFIVKGFTRSALGLCYVLKGKGGLVCWLTEQVDIKCNLVE